MRQLISFLIWGSSIQKKLWKKMIVILENKISKPPGKKNIWSRTLAVLSINTLTTYRRLSIFQWSSLMMDRHANVLKIQYWQSLWTVHWSCTYHGLLDTNLIMAYPTWWGNAGIFVWFIAHITAIRCLSLLGIVYYVIFF